MPNAMAERLARFDSLSPRSNAAVVGVVIELSASFLILLGALILEAKYSISAVCTRVLLWPMVALGLFLMVIFCCGFNGGVMHHNGCLWVLYVIGLSIAIPAIIAFVTFGSIAAGGIDFNGVKVREYKLTEYRGWLRGRVADPQYWSAISACLHDKHACKNMGDLVRDPETGTLVPKESWAKGMQLGDGPMPIESGCCKPPSSCGFTYVNGTTWIPTPGAAPAVDTNVDCSRWRNEQQTLCFQCDSCRAGLLDETKKAWTIGAMILVIVLIGLSTSCCLLAN